MASDQSSFQQPANFLTDHITLHNRPTITPQIRTTGRYQSPQPMLPIRTTPPRRHQRTPSPTPSTRPDSEFLRLQDLIILPEAAFTPANPLHQQIWSADLSAEDLGTLLTDAQILLEHAIRIKSDALRTELENLEEQFAEGVTSPIREEVEDVKGDVCAAVLQRWGFQRDV
ncbi:hypothetical protein LTS16_007771 [Friedmanniomyces endolithicus]|nr:hypothetical protein LTR75_011465 [Friedmanniomyces endolithicus]KAK0814959.1 hypothetical protein LTR59_000714 [Friedmanniomyces endolithicus]KAK0874333.1 hypothetical protein LTS02_000249 [Friedmanniomyces endolithicus]KAK0926966.1 hypothetical protein LTR57_003572 [Friedmanniomyces endolithicus]KAK0976814.1 hypothetical protein LTS01_013296 [Friedmanniomyces endolithicus]